MKIKRITAAVLSLCIVGGAFTFNAPADFDFSMTAEAEGTCYTLNNTTGMLTLKGNVALDEIKNFEQKEAVKKSKLRKEQSCRKTVSCCSGIMSTALQ